MCRRNVERALSADDEGPRAAGCPGGSSRWHRDFCWVGGLAGGGGVGGLAGMGMGMVAPIRAEETDSAPRGHGHPLGKDSVQIPRVGGWMGWGWGG